MGFPEIDFVIFSFKYRPSAKIEELRFHPDGSPHETAIYIFFQYKYRRPCICIMKSIVVWIYDFTYIYDSHPGIDPGERYFIQPPGLLGVRQSGGLEMNPAIVL